MTGAAVEQERAATIGGNGRAACQFGIRLDRDRIVARQSGGAPRRYPAWPEMGIADQRVELDRGVAGRSDHPADQISAAVRTTGPRREFGRQTGAIKASGLAVGSENNFLPHRGGDVEVGLLADKAIGYVRFSR